MKTLIFFTALLLTSTGTQAQVAAADSSIPNIAGVWRLTGAFVPGGRHPLKLTQMGSRLVGVLQINDRCDRPFATATWEETFDGRIEDSTVFLQGIEIRQTVGQCARGYGLHKFTGRVSKDGKKLDGEVILSDNRQQRWTFLR